MNPLSNIKSWLQRGETAAPVHHDLSNAEREDSDDNVPAGDLNHAASASEVDDEEGPADSEAAVDDAGHADESEGPIKFAENPARRKSSGIEIARCQERQALAALHRFGWLVTQDFARLLWPESRYPLDMAYRLTRRLSAKREILIRRTNYGGMIVLAQPGVRRLLDEMGIHARTGKDLEPSNFTHRRLANAYAIERILDPSEWPLCFTEFEIQTRRAPVHTYWHKVPDVLLWDEGACGWVECENARKNQHDFHKLLDFTVEGLRFNMAPAADHPIAEVQFIFENHSTKTRIVNELIRRYKKETQLDWYSFSHRIIFVELSFDRHRVCTGRQMDHFQNTLALLEHGILE